MILLESLHYVLEGKRRMRLVSELEVAVSANGLEMVLEMCCVNLGWK